MNPSRIRELAVAVALAAFMGTALPAFAQAPVPGQQPAEKAKQAADVSKKKAKREQKQAKKSARKAEGRAAKTN